MPDRIEELFAELAESAGEQQQFQIDQQLRQQEAERELYDTDEARTALKIIGGLGLLALTRGRSGGKGLPPDLLNKAYGQVGQDFRKYIIPPLTQVGRRLTGRSGSGVGTDVVGRNPLPKIKDPVVTKRGPRGPTNIDSPNQMPLPLSGGRNTGGISATERAQLPQIGGGISATKTARGDKEFLDKIMPSVRKDITEEASKTNIKGVRFSRKEWEDMLEETATTGKATKSYMDKVKSLKSLEDKLRIEQAKINAGEAPSKNFTKMLEEAARLRALLKSLE